MIIYDQGKILDVSENFGESDASLLLKLLECEDYERAKDLAMKMLKNHPINCEIMQLLGAIYSKEKNFDAAIDILKKAVAIEPENPNNYTNLSLCYSNKGCKEEAVKNAEKAVELNSDPVYLNNLGVQYKNCDMPEKAIKVFRGMMTKVLDPYSISNMAAAYTDILDIDTAIKYLKAAINMAKDLNGAHVNLALCYHLKGMHDEAWREYEYRLDYFAQLVAYLKKFGVEKKWNGKDSLEGKRVLLFCEQGYGDIIQFIRFIPYLKIRGCHIIACCPLPLISLIEPLVDEVLCKELIRSIPTPLYDYHIPTMSLPYLLKISTDKLRTYYNDFKFEPYPIKKTDKLKVGICWQGSKKHLDDRKRSVDLNKFYEVSQLPNIQLYSLQKDIGNPAELKMMNVINHMDDVGDFKDTAHLIAAMDMVISVDTAVLHLAGAMEKKAWCLLAYKPDWRWELDKFSTIWYPSVRLIRQKKRGDWSSVFDEVTNTLTLFSSQLPLP